jgi:hypothetical protein
MRRCAGPHRGAAWRLRSISPNGGVQWLAHGGPNRRRTTLGGMKVIGLNVAVPAARRPLTAGVSTSSTEGGSMSRSGIPSGGMSCSSGVTRGSCTSLSRMNGQRLVRLGGAASEPGDEHRLCEGPRRIVRRRPRRPADQPSARPASDRGGRWSPAVPSGEQGCSAPVALQVHRQHGFGLVLGLQPRLPGLPWCP